MCRSRWRRPQSHAHKPPHLCACCTVTTTTWSLEWARGGWWGAWVNAPDSGQAPHSRHSPHVGNLISLHVSRPRTQPFTSARWHKCQQLPMVRAVHAPHSRTPAPLCVGLCGMEGCWHGVTIHRQLPSRPMVCNHWRTSVTAAAAAAVLVCLRARLAHRWDADA